MITIFIPTPLRRFAGEQSRVQVQASTVSDAIKSLTATYPSLSNYVYDASGDIHRHVRIYLGEEDIRSREGYNTLLKDGDELSIIPAIAGGSL